MRLLKVLFAVVVFLSISVVAFAHPGKTDSNGGHYDHDACEYHYHHGYSAHQHYDSDGDGDLDCPYSFIDKTGSSDNEVSPRIETDSKERETVKRRVINYVVPIICCFALYGVILLIDEIKWRLKK